jgi:hypothetical protein
MYSVSDRAARAVLTAHNSLLGAGLKRIARQVGLDVVPEGDRADLSIRTVDAGIPNPKLDIAVGHHSLVVTVALPFDPDNWELIHLLVEEIGASKDSVETEPGHTRPSSKSGHNRQLPL